MKDPNIKTKVKHSETKSAWNVVGTMLGGKYKICRVPYQTMDDSEILTQRWRDEAKEHADFISYCFNHSEEIINNKK